MVQGTQTDTRATATPRWRWSDHIGWIRQREASPPGQPRPERAGAEEARQLRAGRLLSIASVLPGLLATAWLVAAFPLVLISQFRPYTALPLAVVAAVVIVPLGVRLTWRSAPLGRVPWWPVLASGVLALGFGLFAAGTHDQHVLPRRDAGVYAQVGYWLAHHTGVVYQIPTATFGSSPGDLSWANAGSYQVGSTVIPQFMTGWPTALAAAHWLGGWTGLLMLPGLVGGVGVLAVAGLAGRLVGARWAPLAAALTAGAWPVLRVAQTTYSEPLALVMLAGGACLLLDMVAAGRRDAGARPDLPVRTIRAGAFAASTWP